MLKDPFAPRAKTKWSAMEQSALASYHKEEHALEQVRKMYGSHATTSTTGASSSSGSGGSGSQSIDQQIKAAVNAELKKRGKNGQKGRGKGDEGRGRGRGARADAAESSQREQAPSPAAPAARHLLSILLVQEGSVAVGSSCLRHCCLLVGLGGSSVCGNQRPPEGARTQRCSSC